MHKPLQQLATRCAEEILKHRKVLCVSHIDADGISAAGIIALALKRAGIEYEMRFIRQLDETICKEIGSQQHELVIFTDLGSGQIEHIKSNHINAIIADHHRPQGELPLHLNPHLFNINGAYEVSGSGMAYILANQLGDNRDLAGLAIVGAIGDMQERKKGKLISINRMILEEGSCAVSPVNDLTLFGKQTRPLYKLLMYSSDPYIPGLTDNEQSSRAFIQQTGTDSEKRWIDLSDEQKKELISSLIRYGLSRGLSSATIQHLVGETYILPGEKEGTPMRDTKEYATLLNATGRYGHADIGLAVCLGDRDRAFHQATKLLEQHRINLVEGLNYVKQQGMQQLSHLQYFDAKDKIPDTVVGIVAGMAYSLSNNRNLPVIAFADKDDGHKVSARGTRGLVNKGLDLSKALQLTCEKVGGAGGGHDIAAGATVPFGKKEQFLETLNQIIASQIRT